MRQALLDGRASIAETVAAYPEWAPLAELAGLDPTDATRHIFPDHAETDAPLANAQAIHDAQGITADTAHLIATPDMNSGDLYAAATRGQAHNTDHHEQAQALHHEPADEDEQTAEDEQADEDDDEWGYLAEDPLESQAAEEYPLGDEDDFGL
jgi:hypothetical protein